METAAQILEEEYTGNSLHASTLRLSVMGAAKEPRNRKLPFDNDLIGISQKLHSPDAAGESSLDF